MAHPSGSLEDAAPPAGTTRTGGGARSLSPTILLSTLLLGQAILLVLIALRSVSAGQEWHYVKATTASPFLSFLVLGSLYLLFAFIARRFIGRFEVAVVAASLVAGFAVELGIQHLSRRSLGGWMMQDNFNLTAQQYGVGDLLRHYSRIAPHLILHAKSNMPGKILLFQALRHVTTAPQTMGYIVVALSAIGGVLLYLVTRLLFERPRIALSAMLLFFVVPARSSFVTTMNTVTPLFVLALLLVLLYYLRTGALPLLLLLGGLVYATVLFEPSPLVLTPLAVLLVVRHALMHPEKSVRPVAMIVLPAVGFLIAHVVMLTVFGFDVFGALRHVSADAREFNRVVRPHYADWLMPNLREFLVNAGIALSLLGLVVAIETIAALVSRRTRLRAIVLDPTAVLATTVFGAVVVLDVAGINRGEVSRLWIFLAVLLLPVVASVCAERLPRWSFFVLLAGTLIQTVLVVGVVGFDFADIWDTAIHLPMLHHLTPVLDVYLVAFLALVILASAVHARRAPASRRATQPDASPCRSG